MAKLFSIENTQFRRVITFLGIKIKFLSKKLMYNKMRSSSEPVMSNQRLFMFSNMDKLTDSQKTWFLSKLFYERIGYFPNFKNPKSFNEKINWMKLNYFNPLENIVIDKCEFKKYITEKLGRDYVIPLIGVYNDVNDIDFDALPQQFVIKTTTNGAAKGVEIVRDKSQIDPDYLKYKFNNLMQDWESCYYSILARGYKEIKPRLIIEKYIEQADGQLYDYKFHCFHGEPKLVLAIKNREHGKYNFRFYDENWTPLDLHRGDQDAMTNEIVKPQCYDQMLEVSRKLAKDFPFVRVDFYEVEGKIYVGELTFTPKGGFGKFEPREWDYKLGEWLDLSKIPEEHLKIMPEFTESAKTFLDPAVVDRCTLVEK